jgi:signal transduction histidine kinase
MTFLVGKGFRHPSGRVIALGRLMLATLFGVAVLIDISQPTHYPRIAYALLGSYVAFAAAIVLMTWRNWWLDARLAGVAHAVDIALFAALVLLTAGFTSPFFTFFVFLLLSAAIRWGWNLTAATAILLALLYLIVGMLLVSTDQPFELQRFVVRAGQLVIISLIVIWFGANQWRNAYYLPDEELLSRPELEESPLENSLRAAMAAVDAKVGAFVWREPGREEFQGLEISNGQVNVVKLPAQEFVEDWAASPLLYDLTRNRGLRRDPNRNLERITPGDLIPSRAIETLNLTEGLAIPVHSDRGDGQLFLEQVGNLSTDHIDIGRQVAADVSVHIQRHALLKAAEESAEARSRLTLARDLHDSVVQFIAGAAFRLEAMKRTTGAGRDIEPQLDELKQLMLQEQRELRSFIKSLRSGPLVALNDLAAELKSLAERLTRQWDVSCSFSARSAELMIPTRLRLDAHQLMREAVANAVRHAQAKSIEIELAAEPTELRLVVVNDGAAFKSNRGRVDLPTSLSERVQQAGGLIDLAHGMGVTKLSISLPIGEGPA